MAFDYSSPAELFMPKRKGRVRRSADGYRRFATAAEAIRFAVEEFPAIRTLGAWMQVEDEHFDSDEICCMRVTIIHLHATSPQSAKPKNNCVFGVEHAQRQSTGANGLV